MLWENLTCGEFPEAVARSGGLCVIPLGATEKHGQHLPVGIDTIVVDQIARDAADMEEAVVFPAFGFGQLLGLQHMDGSVCLSTRLLLDYLTEICREIARSGFRKILLLNGHGGNGALVQYFCQSTREQKKDYVVCGGLCWPVKPREMLDIIREQGREAYPELMDEDIAVLEDYVSKPMESGHGDFGETLAMLGVRPGTVRLELMNAEDGESVHRFDHLNRLGIYNPYCWNGNFPNSYAASYHPGANERLGTASRRMMTAKVARLYRAMKEDTELLKINEEWNSQW